MDNSKITREQMSALVDGELQAAQVEAALDALTPACHDTWDVYHQVGDLMRSDELALPLSAGFSARLAARLEAEPVLTAAPAVRDVVRRAPPRSALKKFAIPGVAAAAMAIAAVVATPQLMVADGSSTARPAPVESQVASVPAISKGAMISASAPLVAPEPAQPEAEVVLRDPHIDEYLMAHERYSPSVYSNAQFSRSATFAADAEK